MPTVKETACSFTQLKFGFQHPELMKWFKDFVGFRDGAGGLGSLGSGSEQMSSSDSQRLRPERLTGDSAMEIGEITKSTYSDVCMFEVASTFIKATIKLISRIRFNAGNSHVFLPGGRCLL